MAKGKRKGLGGWGIVIWAIILIGIGCLAGWGTYEGIKYYNEKHPANQEQQEEEPGVGADSIEAQIAYSADIDVVA